MVDKKRECLRKLDDQAQRALDAMKAGMLPVRAAQEYGYRDVSHMDASIVHMERRKYKNAENERRKAAIKARIMMPTLDERARRARGYLRSGYDPFVAAYEAGFRCVREMQDAIGQLEKREIEE